MRTSTEIHSAASVVGYERAVEYVAKAGFDCWDFTMIDMCRYSRKEGRLLDNLNPLAGNDYMAFVKELKKIGLDNGITCNQTHAPFPTDPPQVQSYLKRAIECSAEVGAQYCVIHPMNNGSPEENRDMYLTLLPFAKEHNVKIATENMWNWNEDKTRSCFAACATSESFNAHLNAVNDDYFVACLDIGHAEMQGSGSGAVNMIRALGDRLQLLHMHDNDLLLDAHQLPYRMNIDFEAVLLALKEINYCGDMTLEANAFLKSFAYEQIPTGLQMMAQTARKMADFFD